MTWLMWLDIEGMIEQLRGESARERYLPGVATHPEKLRQVLFVNATAIRGIDGGPRLLERACET